MFLPHKRYDLLDQYESILHFTTTKTGGVSVGKYETLNLGDHVKDDPIAVSQNRELLCDSFNLQHLIIPKQCHTANVAVIHDGTEDISEVDALVTNQKNVCIGVLTADCVPVLLYDPVKSVVAAIHAGWRGLINGVIENTLTKMIGHFGCYTNNIAAVVGPCISKGNYEVGEDVSEHFEKKFFNSYSQLVLEKKDNGKTLCDIRTAAKIILEQQGLKNIEVSQYCTFAAKHTYFSARRDGIESGRFLTAIMLH